MRVLRWVSVGLVWLGAVGCAGRSSDDDDGSQRTEDACEGMCETFADCPSNAFDVDECVVACVGDAAESSRSCSPSFDDLVDCVDDVNRDCDRAVDRCEAAAEVFVDDCEYDFADTLEVITGGGGNCTDSCEWALDGYCDEPGLCPSGTDSTDCGC